jgi:tRNA-specific 2-thiouridylase
MSGGVDSSVTAALLVEAGHDVVGLTLSLYDASTSRRTGRGGTCCSPAEVDAARRACDHLGIPHYTVDERARFSERVIDDFVREYARGRTPNPCVRCNEHVKFGPLLRRAQALGAAVLATGHYARIVDGALLRAVDPDKDQSYFLFALGIERLDRLWFPLGAWTKQAVRERARALGLANHDAPDSQELCFVPDGDHAAVVERRAAAVGLAPEVLAPGEIRDEQGHLLGQHAGIHRVTVGQRRGLGLSSDRPRYVLSVLAAERVVVVGDAGQGARRSIHVADFRRLSPLPERERLRAQVQVRHRSPATAATVALDGDRAHIDFDEPVAAVAPGQAAVVYDGPRVLGGGWID